MSTNHEKQFEYEVRENGGHIAGGWIDDPFVVSDVCVQGFRNALRVLFGRYKLQFFIRGKVGAYRVIFNGDYTPPPSDDATVANFAVGTNQRKAATF